MTDSNTPPRRTQFFPKLVREFPNMPLESLPEIPRDWEDSSDKDAVSPSFIAYTRHDGATIRVWVDYPEEADRELLGKRYSAIWKDAEGDAIGDGFSFVETDDWAELLDAVNAEIKRSPET